MKTEVLLTVDTEFSSGDHFRDPAHCAPVGLPSVDLEIDGRSHGLGFLLDTLGARGMAGTFFVEALHVLHFGDDEMGGVVRRLLDARQDVQLHIHPQWLASEQDSPDSVREFFARTGDNLGTLEPELLRRALRLGTEAIERWGAPRPVAVRAGNLAASRAIYGAQAALDLPVASHVGTAVYEPVDPELRVHSGRHFIDGVLEVPVLSYRAPGTGLRTLTVTGSSFAEQRHLLEAAHAAGLEQVVVLTHCHEFVKRSDRSYTRITRNRVNQGRFTRLCDYLHANRDRFSVTTFGERASDWLQQPATGDKVLSVPAAPAFARIVSNKLNDAFWSW
ncbi:MAG: polysaccharide deacetylase family protein [Planctomycetota bacterium]|jgi:hypothetical protein